MKREPVTEEQVAALQRAFGLGATIITWDVDYSLGRGVRGPTSHCLWNKDGTRIDIEAGRTKILSQTREPDPSRPTRAVADD